MSEPQRYPLDWPVGEPRTPGDRRTWGQFKLSHQRAVDELLEELRLLGVREGDVVISTDLPVRRDGLPYASARLRTGDPGVAVYWTVRGKQHVMACDRYTRIAANIRAIGLTIAALRSVERHGTRRLRDRAFAGFAALPASAGASSWRAVLELGSGPITREDVDAAFRRLARVRHPDYGGTDEAMAELNRARASAVQELAR